MLILAMILTAAPMNTKAVKADLVKQFGAEQGARIDRGVDQVAALWRPADGDFAAFAKANFIADPAVLDATFKRFESNFEQLDGHFLEINRALHTPVELDTGPLLPVDTMFGSYDSSSHVTEDFFSNQLAFVALLNYPLSTLQQKIDDGSKWSRRAWAEARLTRRFDSRVPAAVSQEISKTQATASLYIDSYNIWMHHVFAENGDRLFPKGKRLISHWNLRDELKANYAEKNGIAKQRTIIKIMERIVTQTIPAAVIDNPNVDWSPFTNKVTATPADELEADAPKKPVVTDGKPEADVRYQTLWANYTSQKAADPFSPIAPTAIARAFEGAEMPEARVKALLEEVLSSPLVPKVAAQIEKSLGRKLEPADLWFNGFLPRGSIPETELDAKLRVKYPTAEAYAKDIPRLLMGLGFSKERAAYLSERIRVDPSRGAGHAMQAQRRGDFPHLRTRVEKDGMNYKGYNIAVHEMGHNVEQVFSLYDVDSTLLAGVPNNAFTEAIAFVFQAKDLELMGLGMPTDEQERLRVLNDFWMTYEIAGVALVDIEVWHWMYAHPKAKPAELREATVQIAKAMWNKYYWPVLGGKDTPMLGIYSHMISYPLYLFGYPLGHLIAFQIEEQVRKTGSIGPEIERMAKLGNIGPDVWMVAATGNPVSAGPLLRATEAALAPKR